MRRAVFDFSDLTSFLAHVVDVVEHESIPQVARTHTRIIQNYTLQGYDYMGEQFAKWGDFHDGGGTYSPSQEAIRASAGYGTSVKDLRMGTGRLYDLQLDGDTLTVPADAQDIALGQVTGHSGDWPYSHEFLNVSDDTNNIASHELAEFLQDEIWRV